MADRHINYIIDSAIRELSLRMPPNWTKEHGYKVSWQNGAITWENMSLGAIIQLPSSIIYDHIATIAREQSNMKAKLTALEWLEKAGRLKEGSVTGYARTPHPADEIMHHGARGGGRGVVTATEVMRGQAGGTFSYQDTVPRDVVERDYVRRDKHKRIMDSASDSIDWYRRVAKELNDQLHALAPLLRAIAGQLPATWHDPEFRAEHDIREDKVIADGRLTVGDAISAQLALVSLKRHEAARCAEGAHKTNEWVEARDQKAAELKFGHHYVVPADWQKVELLAGKLTPKQADDVHRFVAGQAEAMRKAMSAELYRNYTGHETLTINPDDKEPKIK